MNPSFLRRKLLDPLLALLRQGVTPERIAISIALGMILGVFPVLGSTTLLCAVVALVLRLNLPAIQLVNYIVYPLQVALLIPFIRLGEKIFRARPLPLSLAQIAAKIHANMWHAIQDLWVTTVHAMVAWMLVCLPVAAIIYFVLLPLLRRLWRAHAHSADVAPAADLHP